MVVRGQLTTALAYALVVGLLALAPPAQQPAAAAQISAKRFHQVLGRSVEDRPITAYFRGNPDGKRQVLVIGQMHGDERAGVRTAKWLRFHVRLNRDTGLWIVPTMNPDGYAHNTRQNAQGVDVNRNWPTDGWTGSGRGGCCWGGKRPGGSPEVRAMRTFLDDVRPDYIASIHQPYGVVAANDKRPRYEKRLSRRLGLPLREVTVGGPDDTVAPTLTSWYNDVHAGTAVTIEYVEHPSKRFVKRRAGKGILRAMHATRR